MEEGLKQRLVGAGVIAALAVIFLPALFDRDERVELDTTSQIPPAPIVEPVNISKPSKPEGIKVPPADKLFQPLVEEQADIDKQEKDQQEIAKVDNKENTEASSSVPLESPVEKDKVKNTEKDTKKDTPITEPAKETVSKTESKPKPSSPALNQEGVPRGWVVQAASFKSSESADKFTQTLIKASYKAYSQSVSTEKGTFYRVFVGPYIDEAKAITAKETIDKAYKLRSRVLRFNPISGA